MKHLFKACFSLICVVSLIVGMFGAMPVGAIAGGGTSGTGVIQAWGCDMSYYNVGGDTLDYSMVDFDLMKADGCEFVILRVGYEASASRVDTLDKAFVGLYNKARAAGMGVGVYFYALAKTQAGAIQDAQWCIDIFEQYDMYFEYPIYYDVEDPGTSSRPSHASLSSAETTALCLGWAQTLEAAGYFPGVYAGAEIFADLTSEYLDYYDTWIAHVKTAYSGTQFDPNTKTTYSTTYGMWQYKWYNTSSSSPSYNGSYWQDSYGYPLDCNVSYKDYPTIMQTYGYNNMVTKHKITYETNGGTAVDPSYVADGQTLTAPTAPTKYGFNFAGWYCNPELTDAYDFSTPVPYDFVLYAKWEEAYWGANTNLMPNSVQMQYNAFNDAGESVWAYWNDDAYGSVTLYNAVTADWSWPSTYMTYENSFDANNDRYVYFKKEGTAYFNADITYMAADGELYTVKLSEVAGLTDSDFQPGYVEYLVDFGGYIQSQGHMPASGNVKFTKVTYYTVGAKDSYVKLYDMKLTPAIDIPDSYVSLYDKNVQQVGGNGYYTYQNGVLYMTATSAQGYSVKFDTNKTFNPTEMTYFLMDLSSTVPFNITLELTTATGDATVEVRKEFFNEFGLAEAPEALPAGEWLPVMNMLGYYEWNGGIIDSSTIRSVTVSMQGQGDLTMKALQVSRNNYIVYVQDGENASGSTTGSDLPNIITSSVYEVTNTVIADVAAGTTAEEFLANLDQGDYVSVFDQNGNVVSSTDAVGTGMIAKLMHGDTVVREYTVSVKGDINGDCAVTTSDARLILSKLLGSATFTEAQELAADYDSNAEISTGDARLILMSLIG